MLNNKIPFTTDLITDIVDRFDTPAYIYDESTIRNKCRDLKKVFKDLPVKWLYAIKANDNPFILNVIAAEGFGFDTVSFEEVLLSLRFQDNPKDIFYTENNMTDREMEEAIQSGVSVNVGSFSRLESYFRHEKQKNVRSESNPISGTDIMNGLIPGISTVNSESVWISYPNAWNSLKNMGRKSPGCICISGVVLKMPEILPKP